jgi:hypothetical protein
MRSARTTEWWPRKTNKRKRRYLAVNAETPRLALLHLPDENNYAVVLYDRTRAVAMALSA